MSEIYESLYVTLLEEEIARYATEMACLDETIRIREEDAKRAAAAAKEEIRTLDARRAGLAQRVRERKERRDIPVTEQKDFARKAISTIRLDTGEVVRERAMSSGELQTELSLAASPPQQEPAPRRKRPAGRSPMSAESFEEVSLAKCSIESEDLAD